MTREEKIGRMGWTMRNEAIDDVAPQANSVELEEGFR